MNVLDLALAGHNVFFCGSGGTEKTFTVKRLVNILGSKRKVVITYEVSQLSRKTFETINYIAQGVRGDEKPFGGIQVIALGDFKQLPPVSNDLDQGKYCFESPLWKIMFCHNIQLKVVYRQEQKDFIDVLDQIAVGEMSESALHFIYDLSLNNLNENDFGLNFIPHISCTIFDANFQG
ncbi:ATP-dependent DNA helicase PIF1-like [Dendronephthya gigantea]|uniref:ATP-dependent DNA helicase PIF1-like n=1 Tax=Dendronephthya gigantea TaxID=151771 RepID=UPI00106AC81F|nr:ATP-dependent DNA helicase PIF1-like [Dendronephthya gigantea]